MIIEILWKFGICFWLYFVNNIGLWEWVYIYIYIYILYNLVYIFVSLLLLHIRLSYNISVYLCILCILKGIIYKQNILLSGITVVHCYIGKGEMSTTFHRVHIFLCKCDWWYDNLFDSFLLSARFVVFYLKIIRLGNGSYIVFSMPLPYAVDDTSEGAIVQRRGRFKVTSADPSSMVCISWKIYIFFPSQYSSNLPQTSIICMLNHQSMCSLISNLKLASLIICNIILSINICITSSFVLLSL
jgi:hypothetical protein